ncbi:hypothetical protein TNCV_1608121 [Trichonephila clavipes]|nr:hypothetical protein TNCV_1608121 [Trichonephila clavipes]
MPSLLWLMKILCPSEIDEVISAEIPNTEIDQNLYDTVTKNMIQGPLGALNPHEGRKMYQKVPKSTFKRYSKQRQRLSSAQE